MEREKRFQRKQTKKEDIAEIRTEQRQEAAATAGRFEKIGRTGSEDGRDTNWAHFHPTRPKHFRQSGLADPPRKKNLLSPFSPPSPSLPLTFFPRRAKHSPARHWSVSRTLPLPICPLSFFLVSCVCFSSFVFSTECKKSITFIFIDTLAGELLRPVRGEN